MGASVSAEAQAAQEPAEHDRSSSATYWASPKGGLQPPWLTAAGQLPQPGGAHVLAAARPGGPAAGLWSGAVPAAHAGGPALRHQPAGPRLLRPPARPHTTEHTMIIWDWDDTLMCSSPPGVINSNAVQPHHAERLDALLEQVLMLSMRLGETCIVTNAEQVWVTESSRRFAPRALALLPKIQVVSARQKYQRSYPGDVFAWKREAFREVLTECKVPSSGVLKLVALGDSMAEIQAAQTSTTNLPHPVVVNTVKFKEAPSCDELIEQLCILLQELAAIVNDERSISINLASIVFNQRSASLWPRPATGLLGTSLELRQAMPFMPSQIRAAPKAGCAGAPAHARGL
ncbi:unnamed protein product [Prorocentrum cordatum]|uniref:Protein-serine/threonine phosphatase n=1 Tax=Prorocentrum cordatum TaxID=2364126 RepID=A0ABN9PSK0_9DINO|nr:unnamed protein product [Polarella glacialis]